MSFWLVCLFALALGFVFIWYVNPDRCENPSKAQTFVAKTWIIFRRIASFTAAAGGFFVIYILWNTADALEDKLGPILLVAFLSLFFVYVGIVGQGPNRYDFSDDLKLYKKIKKKYRMRW